MKSSFSSWKRIISLGAALALLFVATPSGSDRALAGEGHHGGGGGGGGGWGGGGGRWRRHRSWHHSPQRGHSPLAGAPSCGAERLPTGTRAVTQGLCEARQEGPGHRQCEPPKIYRKGKGCVTPKGPDVAKCNHPMVMRKGKCVRPEPEIAKCDHPKIYRKGKGCVLPPTIVSCRRLWFRSGARPRDRRDSAGGTGAVRATAAAAGLACSAAAVEPVALVDPASNARCLPGISTICLRRPTASGRRSTAALRRACRSRLLHRGGA